MKHTLNVQTGISELDIFTYMWPADPGHLSAYSAVLNPPSLWSFCGG